MDQKEIEFLIKEGEGLTVEFREKYTSRIDQDLVAFVNTKGGKIILGINDENKVVGARLTNEVKSQVTSLARNCHPSIPISIKQVGPVTVIEVPEGEEKPYSCSDGYYRRLDATSQKMSPAEIKNFFRESVDVFFEGFPRKEVALKDISFTKINTFLRETKTTLKVSRDTVVPFLTSLGVYEKGHVNNAGVLMFANNIQRFAHHSESILIAFKGTSKMHIYDRLDVRDDLLTQLYKAEEFLRKHLNIRSEITGFRREDIYEIPTKALREALVNALVHRDYSIRGTNISVEVYDDRVEIVNPGGIPQALDKNLFGKNTSIRRNPLIADLFSRMHMMERSGSGIGKIRELLEQADLKPPHFELEGFFRTTFYRDPKYSLKLREAKGVERGVDKGVERGVDKGTDTLTPIEMKIYRLIEQDPKISKEEIRKRGKLGKKAVEYNIEKLKEKEILRRVGSDRGGHWEVKG